MSRAILFAVAGVACGCSSVPAPATAGGSDDPQTMWTFQSPTYFAENDLALGSALTSEIALLSKQPGSMANWIRVLNTTTGKELWHVDNVAFVIHPRDSVEPLWTLNYDLGALDGPCQPMIQLDPRTGKELRRSTIEGFKECGPGNTFFSTGNGFIYELAHGTLMQIDPGLGKVNWRKPVAQSTASAYALTPVGDRVLIGCDLYDLTNGALVKSLADGGSGCHAATGANNRLFVQYDAPAQAVEINAGGEKIATLPGKLVSADGANAAAFLEANGKESLTIYRDGKPIHSIGPAAKDGIRAVALKGDDLFWYAVGDEQLHRRNLVTGHEKAIYKATSHSVISPDATGTAPAMISTPPVYAAPYLALVDFSSVVLLRLAP